jgi:hypothetical protein
VYTDTAHLPHFLSKAAAAAAVAGRLKNIIIIMFEKRACDGNLSEQTVIKPMFL